MTPTKCKLKIITKLLQLSALAKTNVVLRFKAHGLQFTINLWECCLKMALVYWQTSDITWGQRTLNKSKNQVVTFSLPYIQQRSSIQHLLTGSVMKQWLASLKTLLVRMVVVLLIIEYNAFMVFRQKKKNLTLKLLIMVRKLILSNLRPPLFSLTTLLKSSTTFFLKNGWCLITMPNRGIIWLLLTSHQMKLIYLLKLLIKIIMDGKLMFACFKEATQALVIIVTILHCFKKPPR